MNIKRFEHINESSNVNWKEKFKKHYDLKMSVEKEFDAMYDDVREILTSFLKTRKAFDETDIEDIYVTSFGYYPTNEYLTFRINYTGSVPFDDEDVVFYDLDEKEFNDLLKFLKNPELYINVKNYNL